MEAQQPITDDELGRVDAALTKTNGHRAAAARLLGIKAERVYTLIKQSPEMRLKWGTDKAEPIDPVIGEIDRKPSLISPADEAVAVAVAKQDNMLSKGLRNTSLFKSEEVDFLASIEHTYGSNIVGTLQLAQAGMAHSLVKLLMLQRKLEGLIEHIDANPDDYIREVHVPGGAINIGKDAHEFRLELVDRLITVSGEIRKMSESGNKAALTRAQVEKIRADLSGASGKPTKPEFSKGGPPMAIQMNLAAGSSVSLGNSK